MSGSDFSQFLTLPQALTDCDVIYERAPDRSEILTYIITLLRSIHLCSSARQCFLHLVHHRGHWRPFFLAFADGAVAGAARAAGGAAVVGVGRPGSRSLS